MKLYLEIIEQVDPNEARDPKVVQVEVKDRDEAVAILPGYEEQFSGMVYVKRLHTCHHPEEGLCTVENL